MEVIDWVGGLNKQVFGSKSWNTDQAQLFYPGIDGGDGDNNDDDDDDDDEDDDDDDEDDTAAALLTLSLPRRVLSSKLKKKILNFILQNCQKQTAPHESTAQ